MNEPPVPTSLSADQMMQLKSSRPTDAFASRTVVELRREANPDSEGSFTIFTSGGAAEAQVRMKYARHWTFWSPAAGPIADFSSLRRIQVRLLGHAKELKVWVHRVTAEGDSEGIPIRLSVASAGQAGGLELHSLAGKAVLPITEGSVDLDMELLGPASEGKTTH